MEQRSIESIIMALNAAAARPVDLEDIAKLEAVHRQPPP